MLNKMRTIAIGSAMSLLASVCGNATLLLQDTFTADTVGAPPLVNASPGTGLVTTAYSLVYSPSVTGTNTALVQNTYTDPVNSVVFGTGNVLVLNDASTTDLVGVKFLINAANYISTASPVDANVAEIQFDMLRQTVTGGGNFFILPLYNSSSSIPSANLTLGVNGGINASPAGIVPFDTDLRIRILLDYGTGIESVYVNDTLQYTQSFDSTKAFAGLYFLGNNGGKSIVALDNVTFAAIPEPSPVALTALAVTCFCGLLWRRRRV